MKKYILLVLTLVSTFVLTGCIKRDKMDNINIITTAYPITYLTEKIYGDNSTILSIYPNGIDISNYEITDKQIKEYAKANLFIYNGLDANEKKLATRLINENKNIKLIDATQGLKVNSSIEELWISPANYLMLAQNIKEHLSDFITSTVLKNNVEKQYEKIKLTISLYDANFKIIAENATYKDIIINKNSLSFLSRYGFNIITLDESENKYKSNLTRAKDNLSAGSNNMIFAIDGNVNDDIKAINTTIVNVRSMNNLSLEDVKEKNTYETMMNDFIEQLRTEAYS